MFLNSKFKKAYTMYELIVYTVLIGLVLYPMASMLDFGSKTLKENDDKYITNYASFEADLKNDFLFEQGGVSSIQNGTNWLKIQRIDNCIVNYNFNSTLKQISKTIENGCSSTKDIRQYNVDKIDNLDISFDTDKQIYIISVSKTIDNLNYKYVFYKKPRT